MSPTPNAHMERVIRIYEAVRDATTDVLNKELGDPLPATSLLLGAAAAAGATIDMIEMKTGGKMSRETALGIFMRYLVEGLEHPSPVAIPGADDPPQEFDA